MKLAELLQEKNNDGITVYEPGGERVVRFRDHEKFIKLCLKELRSGSISEVQYWVKMCKNAGYNYSEFKTIEQSIGKIAEGTSEYGIKIGDFGGFKLVKFKDKDKFIRLCLHRLKHGTSQSSNDVEQWIEKCKNAGYDYPEFKTIEKSIGKLGEAKGSYIHPSLVDISFGDREKLIKYLLRLLKNGYDTDRVCGYIKMARDDGYDYPEFKAIEKSIGK